MLRLLVFTRVKSSIGYQDQAQLVFWDRMDPQSHRKRLQALHHIVCIVHMFHGRFGNTDASIEAAEEASGLPSRETQFHEVIRPRSCVFSLSDSCVDWFQSCVDELSHSDLKAVVFQLAQVTYSVVGSFLRSQAVHLSKREHGFQLLHSLPCLVRHAFLHPLLGAQQVVQKAPMGLEFPKCLQSEGNWMWYWKQRQLKNVAKILMTAQKHVKAVAKILMK